MLLVNIYWPWETECACSLACCFNFHALKWEKGLSRGQGLALQSSSALNIAKDRRHFWHLPLSHPGVTSSEQDIASLSAPAFEPSARPKPLWYLWLCKNFAFLRSLLQRKECKSLILVPKPKNCLCPWETALSQMCLHGQSLHWAQHQVTTIPPGLWRRSALRQQTPTTLL